MSENTETTETTETTDTAEIDPGQDFNPELHYKLGEEEGDARILQFFNPSAETLADLAAVKEALYRIRQRADLVFTSLLVVSPELPSKSDMSLVVAGPAPVLHAHLRHALEGLEGQVSSLKTQYKAMYLEAYQQVGADHPLSALFGGHFDDLITSRICQKQCRQLTNLVAANKGIDLEALAAQEEEEAKAAGKEPCPGCGKYHD